MFDVYRGGPDPGLERNANERAEGPPGQSLLGTTSKVWVSQLSAPVNTGVNSQVKAHTTEYSIVWSSWHFVVSMEFCLK